MAVRTTVSTRCNIGEPLSERCWSAKPGLKPLITNDGMSVSVPVRTTPKSIAYQVMHIE